MPNSAERFRKRTLLALEKAKISQSELARLCGMNQSQINSYLRGRIVPGLDVLDRIAAALGVGVHDLIAGEIPEPRTVVIREELTLTDRELEVSSRAARLALEQFYTNSVELEKLKKVLGNGLISRIAAFDDVELSELTSAVDDIESTRPDDSKSNERIG